MNWRAIAVFGAFLAGAAPVRAQDPLREVALLAERAPERALARIRALDASVAARTDVRYLRARLLERLGHDARALAALPDVDGAVPPGVQVDLRRRRAVLLARTGRCVEALSLVEVLERERNGTFALEQAAVECALALGDVDGARGRLRAIDGPEAAVVDLRIRLADVLHAGAFQAEARAELRDVAVAHPAHPRASEAVRRLRMFGGAPFTREERLVRARGLFDARRYEEALVELDAADTVEAADEKARLLHLRGMTLYRMRTRYLEAAKTLENAARLGKRTRAVDAFHAARARSRGGQDRRAIRDYRRLAGRHPKSRHAVEARYLAAWLELRLGLRAGERNMRRFLDGRDARREPRLARAGRFDLAMRMFDRRRYRDAERGFERTVREAKTRMDRARGHYWAGRAAERAHRRAAAVAHHRAALTAEALGWYALLARERLKVLGKEPGGPFDAGKKHRASSAVAADPAVAPPPEAAFYARLGLRRDAVRVLRSAERTYGRETRDAAALTRAYHAVGEYARPHRIVARRHDTLLRLPPGATNAWAWRASYGRPHEQTVAAASRQAGIETELAYAVMRKESAFRADVVSSADAIGLMQLIPETAERVADELGETYRRDALLNPDTNVRWGVHLLGRLMREFDGQAPLAIAAYNAGAHRVRPWLARDAKRGRVELDRFVERIPITQTRNYVRRVVRGWARYAYLQRPSRGWPFALPRYLDSKARRRP